MRIAPLFLTALLVAGASSCRSTSNHHLRLKARADDQQIAAGDLVTIVDELRPDVVMASARIPVDGRMELPSLGLIEVSARSPRDLESELTARYGEHFSETQVSVEVLPPEGRYYVYGEVHLPGRFPLSEDVTAFEAVQSAHPDSYFANLNEVRLLRGDGEEERELILNIRRMARGDTTFNVQLNDGDILYVPRTAVGKLLGPVRGEPDRDDPEVRRLRVDEDEQ